MPTTGMPLSFYVRHSDSARTFVRRMLRTSPNAVSSFVKLTHEMRALVVHDEIDEWLATTSAECAS